MGLHGYSNGERTLFINADNGSAIFGKQGPGQIILDPNSNEALLYSSSFWKSYQENGLPNTTYKYNNKKYNNQNNEGMLIDLTAPRIIYGNGKFMVDENGKLSAQEAAIYGDIYASYLEATDGGKIAGFTFNGYALYNGKDSWSSKTDGIYISPSGIALGAYDDGRGSASGEAIGNPFEIDSSGKIKCINGEIGGWKINDYQIYSGITKLESFDNESGTDGYGKLTIPFIVLPSTNYHFEPISGQGSAGIGNFLGKSGSSSSTTNVVGIISDSRSIVLQANKNNIRLSAGSSGTKDIYLESEHIYWNGQDLNLYAVFK